MTSLFYKRNPVTVVDSIMGSGKTSWAIRYINESSANKRFMFVTPYLTEVQRIIRGTNKEFVEPTKANEQDKKLNDLKQLINGGRNIACTHELLKKSDRELIQLLDGANYTLILDEALDVITQVEKSSDDIGILINAKDDNGNPVINISDQGEVKWVNDDYKEGSYTSIRNVANCGNLMYFEEEVKKKMQRSMYWIFPVDIFTAFEEVYILTYMFNGQVQSYYFQLHHINYIFKSVREINGIYTLVDYIDFKNEDRSHLKELFNIYYKRPRDQEDINSIGDKHNAFSTNYLSTKVKNKSFREVTKNHCRNFYRHKAKLRTEDVMWTVKEEHKEILCPLGLKERFVPMNARATNEYSNVKGCIYLVNRYMIPNIFKFFSKRDIKVNQELFALSELLQWLFRSAIRNGEPIDVYIPSSRMRGLLERYLDNEI